MYHLPIWRWTPFEVTLKAGNHKTLADILTVSTTDEALEVELEGALTQIPRP